MPSIRVSNEYYKYLNDISNWTKATTPSQAIERLIDREIENIGNDKDSQIDEAEVVDFEEAPDLAYTQVIKATVNNSQIETRLDWTKLLEVLINTLHNNGLSGEDLINELNLPSKIGQYENEHSRYFPDANISILWRNINEYWSEIERLSNKCNIPVMVTFKWKKKDKALHPGKIGKLQSGC